MYMRRCIELAQKGAGFTSPNPMVGALLVHDGRIIGEGWHREYGKAHAEVDCLNSVMEQDRHLVPECTMYVTLEPCAHHGKTPPCATRLVQERVKRVVVAGKDPFARVNGQGMAILQAAGVDTETGLLEQEAAWLNRRFFTFHTDRRPYIILKWAQSTDGYMAPADRSRQQLTNEASALLVHKWRTEEAAIMVGTTTAINDDPQLTARKWPGRQPMRVVLDRELKIPRFHHVHNSLAPTLVINGICDERRESMELLKLPFDSQLLPAILSALHERGILSVIVEGGANLLQQFIEAGLWDEARIFTAELTMGQGLAAPLLKNGEMIMQQTLETDQLHVFLRRGSAYPYVQGMPL